MEKLTSPQKEIIESNKIDFKKLEKEIDISIINHKFLEDLANLVLKIKNKIQEYDTILSDDTGGRLISLLFQKLHKYKTGKSPSTYFLASGRLFLNAESKIALEKFIEKKSKDIRRCLVVTEYISTGKSMTELMRLLEKNNIKFDIAALSVDWALSHFHPEIVEKLYYGERGSTSGLRLYAKNQYFGVTKEGTITAHPAKKIAMEGDQEAVKKARRGISLIAKEFEKLL